MIVISFYSCVEFFGVVCQHGCEVLPNGYVDCPSCSLCNEKILPFSLGLIIPNYLIVCLIVYIIKKIKSKLEYNPSTPSRQDL